MIIRNKPLWFTWLAFSGLSWSLFGWLGNKISAGLAAQFQQKLVQLSDGKFPDPVRFVHGRIEEALWIMTAAGTILLAAKFVFDWFSAKTSSNIIPHYRPILVASCWFILLNLFLLVAGRTVLFWSLLYDPVNIDNFVQYHIKRGLFGEIQTKQRIVLLGNSQTNRSIDETIINQSLQGKAWATELTQPGARGFDLLSISRDIPLSKGDLVVCYLSEVFFFGDGGDAAAADFFRFRDLPDWLQLGGNHISNPAAIRDGLAGNLIPLYRYHKSLSRRWLGYSWVELSQQQFNANLENDLHRQAQRRAPSLKPGPSATFQQQSFAKAIAELSQRGCHVLIIAGHTHPALQSNMLPSLRPAMMHVLDTIHNQHPDTVRILDASTLFTPNESDFFDLVHFNDQAQERFTRKLVGICIQPEKNELPHFYKNN